MFELIYFYVTVITLFFLFFLPGEVEEGFPDFGPPSFEVVYQNETLSFGEAASELSSSLIIPFILILESIAIAKAFGKIFVSMTKICSDCLLLQPRARRSTPPRRCWPSDSPTFWAPSSSPSRSLAPSPGLPWITPRVWRLPSGESTQVLCCFVEIQTIQDGEVLWFNKKMQFLLLPLMVFLTNVT